MVAPFPPRRLAKSLIRRLRLKQGSRVLDVGCGNGTLVGLLRRVKMEAYGLFDGPPANHIAEGADVPDLQPATLHQSIPFLAQSFDAVLVRQTRDYKGSLASPEACTATANLLAALKPGGRFVYCGETDFSQMKPHLAQFPGQGKLVTLGTDGIVQWVMRLTGMARPGLPALELTIPDKPISRLEWHRIARESVARLSRAAVEGRIEESKRSSESPAA